MTLPEWRELQSLLVEIHQLQHLDAEYVFTRLRYDHAFHFVATKTEVSDSRPFDLWMLNLTFLHNR